MPLLQPTGARMPLSHVDKHEEIGYAGLLGTGHAWVQRPGFEAFKFPLLV